MTKAMKVLFESKDEGWENFGTVYQKYIRPYTIELGSTGRLYFRQNGKLESFEKVEGINMQFSTRKEVFEYLFDTYIDMENLPKYSERKAKFLAENM